MTELPAHAVAEINAAKGRRKKELERWWGSWAAVGDAKDRHRAAIDALDVLVAPLAGKKITGPTVARIRKAERDIEEAAVLVDAAIAHHKAGG